MISHDSRSKQERPKNKPISWIVAGVLASVFVAVAISTMVEDSIPSTCAGITAELDEIRSRNTGLDSAGNRIVKPAAEWRDGDWSRLQDLLQEITDIQNEQGDAACSLGE